MAAVTRRAGARVGDGQPAFDWPVATALGRADFVVGAANAQAVEAIAQWQAGSAAALVVVGPPASGKSHLAEIWREEVGATPLSPARLADHLPQLGAAPALLLEDLGARLSPAEETALFHLLNRVSELKGRLMMTAMAPPPRWPTALPDLASRLAALPLARLAPPDDALLAAILRKHFQDRQLRVEDAVIDYLLRRMERSFAAASRLAARLDRAGLEGRRPVTRALAAQILDTDAPEPPGDPA